MLTVKSGVKHLQEIVAAGFETPAINQIEACLCSLLCSLMINSSLSASSVLSATSDSGVLSEAFNRRASLLPYHQRQHGPSGHQCIVKKGAVYF